MVNCPHDKIIVMLMSAHPGYLMGEEPGTVVYELAPAERTDKAICTVCGADFSRLPLIQVIPDRCNLTTTPIRQPSEKPKPLVDIFVSVTGIFLVAIVRNRGLFF